MPHLPSDEEPCRFARKGNTHRTVGHLRVQRADNVHLTQTSQLIRTLALTPTSPALAAFSGLVAHETGDARACEGALAWLEATIAEYPAVPVDASHQLEKCLAAAHYYHLALLTRRARKVDDAKLAHYIEFASQQKWFNQPRMATQVALLAGELVIADEARRYLRTNLDEWRLQHHWISMMLASVGLASTFTAQEIDWLIHDVGLLLASDHPDIETLAWALLALRDLEDERADALMVLLADKLLGLLKTRESTLRAVADLQALLYLAEAPISEADFAIHANALRRTSDSTIVRGANIENGNLIISICDELGSPHESEYLSMEDLALATYSLTACGFTSIVGVDSKHGDDLQSALAKASSIRPGHFIVPPWEMRIYNSLLLILMIIASCGWVFWTTGGSFVPKPDWLSVMQGAVVPAGVGIVAIMIGWARRGTALTGLLTWVADLTGHKAEHVDARIMEDQHD